MRKHVIKPAHAYKVEIFMAGDIKHAKQVCQAYCDSVGLCVTLSPTDYIFTGGSEEGFVVGLINYPRFPVRGKDFSSIRTKANDLAMLLMQQLGQGSFTVQDAETAMFYSEREVDVAQD